MPSGVSYCHAFLGQRWCMTVIVMPSWVSADAWQLLSCLPGSVLKHGSYCCAFLRQRLCVAACGRHRNCQQNFTIKLPMFAPPTYLAGLKWNHDCLNIWCACGLINEKLCYITKKNCALHTNVELFNFYNIDQAMMTVCRHCTFFCTPHAVDQTSVWKHDDHV